MFFMLFLIATSQCPYGQSLSSAGACEPCAVSNCAYCSNSQVLTCQACVQPYILGQSAQTCECPTGYGSIENGGCILCNVPNCAQCSLPKNNMCELCKENFSNKKTSEGIQCVCESPFIMNSQGECVCPPGQGFNSNRGCSQCSTQNCEICSSSGIGLCDKCYGSALLSDDNTTCSCPLGQGPALNIGCAACRTENCASCSNAILPRCDVCLPNFQKIVSVTQTICVCNQPFELRPDGSCECPSTQGPNGQGGCSLCQVDNCNSCQQSDFTKCSLCMKPYLLSDDGSQCLCPPGSLPAQGGGCTQCLVKHCSSCNLPESNSCNQCFANFNLLTTGKASQCICNLPFYVNEQGECTCPPGTLQTGDQQCTPCSINKCEECPSVNSTVCNKCAPTYQLSEYRDQCVCPLGMAPLNGYSCAPCADSNCESCENSAIDVCQSCKGNFTIQVKQFNNQTNQVQSNYCSCQKPFIQDGNGNCFCPEGKTYNMGTCQKCAVNNCKNCEDPNILCSSCFSPFILNQQGNKCVCQEGYVQANGGCQPCQISNCAVCDSSQTDNCQQCLTNFKLSSKVYTKTINDGNTQKNVTMNTATCVCSSPFILNAQGQCGCPTGMFQDSQQGCIACQVSNCQKCSNAQQCEICSQSFILTQQNQCACPSGYGINKDDICQTCALTNCSICSTSEELKCQVCATNFSLVINQGDGIQNHQCLCLSPYTLNQNGQCQLNCPPGTVVDGNTCVPCKIYKCDACSASDQYSCNKCMSPFVLAQDGKQCVCPVGSGPLKNTCQSCTDSRCALCPVSLGSCYQCKAPFELNSQGKCDCPRGSGADRYGICSTCVVSNCGQCQTSYAASCVSCIYPSVLSSDKSKCECPLGQAIMPDGGCAPCAIQNCQQCQNSVQRLCTRCKPSFILDDQSHQCRCPPSQGKNMHGSCETCQVENCVQCYHSSFTCSVCEEPYVSNSQGTSCVCPIGQAPNSQGGCAKCQVGYCKQCPTSDQYLCDQCFPMFELNKNKTKCYWPDQNMDGCPLGHGLDGNQQCQFCSVPYCIKCYSDLNTCSICEAPFITNSDGTQCVCPRGQATNGQGGCAYCQVNDCEVCSSSLSSSCSQCFYPFVLKGNQCQMPHGHQSPIQRIIGDGKDAYNGASDISSGISDVMNFFPSIEDQISDHFAIGFLFGFLLFILILSIFVIGYNFYQNKKKQSLLQNPQSNNSFEVQMPKSHTKIA